MSSHGHPTLARLAPLAAFFAASLASCVSVNQPLKGPLTAGDEGCAVPAGEQRPYRFSCLESAHSDSSANEVFIVLALSGGGTRAAAFAYGALSLLEDTKLPDGRSVLDEVDVISSVSGGSFAAAYLGKFGKDRFFREFPERVLYRNIQAGYGLRLFSPWYWPSLLSPFYGRGDLAASYYDAGIFEGATYESMPRRRPFVVLNATDIGQGAGFSFTQDHFDRLCSNLDSVPIGRAVAASSAFPIVFTPLTLVNYNYDNSSCRYATPGWVSDAGSDAIGDMAGYDRARTWMSYEDAGRRPYVHLSDGGIADNIGLRAIEEAMLDSAALPGIRQTEGIKHLVLITVDAKPRPDKCSDRIARPPGVLTVLSAAATSPMENYSSDTVQRFSEIAVDLEAERSAAPDFADCDKLAARGCSGNGRRDCRERESHECREKLLEVCIARGDGLYRRQCEEDDEIDLPECYRQRCAAALAARDPGVPNTQLVHLRFDAVPEECAEVRARLQNIGTSLHLPRSDVELLTAWGRQLLATSPAYNEFADSIGARVSSRNEAQAASKRTTDKVRCVDGTETHPVAIGKGAP
jgi:NTE family protein